MMDRTVDSYRLQDRGHAHEEKGEHAGGGGFQGEDEDEEEELVKDEARLYAITVERQDIS